MGVRALGAGVILPPSKRVGKGASKEDIDAAMLWLQMQRGCFVQMSENLEELKRFIVGFTGSIATVQERM
jgi:hypothetical protein